MAHHMESIGFYQVEDILPHIQGGHEMVFGEETVRAGSLRLQTFRHKGTDCVVCGCTGAYFSVERQIWRNKARTRPFRGGYHINLYGVTKNGNVRLMTHDHIIPLANYGANTLDNSTVMCEKCNCNKGSKIPSAEFVRMHGCDIIIPKKVFNEQTCTS